MPVGKTTCSKCNKKIDNRSYAQHTRKCGSNPLPKKKSKKDVTNQDVNFCPRCGFKIGILLAMLK